MVITRGFKVMVSKPNCHDFVTDKILCVGRLWKNFKKKFVGKWLKLTKWNPVKWPTLYVLPSYIRNLDTDCCTRNCCGRRRPWKIVVWDGRGNEIMHIDRSLRCTTCWCPCCLQVRNSIMKLRADGCSSLRMKKNNIVMFQKVKVFAPPGHLMGSVSQNWSLCFPELTVRNETDEAVLRITGPFCTFSCFGSDVEFEVRVWEHYNYRDIPKYRPSPSPT